MTTNHTTSTPDNFDAARVAEEILLKHYQDSMRSATRLANAITAALRDAHAEGVRRSVGWSHKQFNADDFRLVSCGPAGEVCLAPKEGHVIDDRGVVRKVLGQLPITADGCVYGMNAPGVYSWYPFDQAAVARVSRVHCVASDEGCTECGNDDWFLPSEVYSTREAAEAAKEKA